MLAAELQTADFSDYFDAVEDPRMVRTKRHDLQNILFVSVAATIAGAEGPSDIADFTRQQLAWCRKFVPLEKGVPSHDTFSRVLSLIKPEQFQIAFLDWIAAFTTSADDNEPRFMSIAWSTDFLQNLLLCAN